MKTAPIALAVAKVLLAPFLDLPPDLGRKRNFRIWGGLELKNSQGCQ